MKITTEIEWLRARWMEEHGYARYSGDDLAAFYAPDLTAEEIRDHEFEDLDDLIQFVRQVKATDR